MDTAAVFRVLGDGLSIVSLSLIASSSLNAWKRTPPDVTVPMQWNSAGKPNWRAKRTFAFAFTPVLAVLILLAPTAMRVTYRTEGFEAVVILFAIRSLAAAIFAIANLYFIRHAFLTLEEEGVRLSS